MKQRNHCHPYGHNRQKIGIPSVIQVQNRQILHRRTNQEQEVRSADRRFLAPKQSMPDTNMPQSHWFVENIVSSLPVRPPAIHRDGAYCPPVTQVFSCRYYSTRIHRFQDFDILRIVYSFECVGRDRHQGEYPRRRRPFIPEAVCANYLRAAS